MRKHTPLHFSRRLAWLARSLPLSLSSFRFWDGVHLGGGVGRLSLDVYDTADKQLVWRGSATRTLDDKASPQKRQDNINKATAKLLKNYPPPAKK